MSSWQFWALLALLGFVLFNVVLLLPSVDQQNNTCKEVKPIEVIKYINQTVEVVKYIKQNQNGDQNTHSDRKPRPPTLVIYVYAKRNNGGSVQTNNFKHFLEHGLCEDCENVDYAFINNGPNDIQIPQHKNVRVYNRENTCGDFGAWDHLFSTLTEAEMKKYKRFMFINDTVKGPYVDPTFYLIFGKGFHFTDIFNSYITSETRLVGSYVNCGTVWGKNPGNGFVHVQSMSYMLDDVALGLLRHRIKCYDDKITAVVEGEIGLSRQLLTENNINIGCLLYSYRGIDFRKNEHVRKDCNGQSDPSYENEYFGLTVNPMEVVFYKNTRGGNMVAKMDQYSQWPAAIGPMQPI